jgi:hypothetical protein
LLWNVVFQGSGLGGQIRTLLALQLILIIELVNFFRILSISLP